MSTLPGRCQCEERRTAGVMLLRDQAGQPIGKVVEATQDQVVGRGAGTVLLLRRPPNPSGD
jgi:hypothetical protein